MLLGTRHTCAKTNEHAYIYTLQLLPQTVIKLIIETTVRTNGFCRCKPDRSIGTLLAQFPRLTSRARQDCFTNMLCCLQFFSGGSSCQPRVKPYLPPFNGPCPPHPVRPSVSVYLPTCNSSVSFHTALLWGRDDFPHFALTVYKYAPPPTTAVDGIG